MEANKEVTVAQRNYFVPGSYLYRFKEEFTYAGVANIITTTLLAPLQRWRIIAQTQRAYPLRPKRFSSFLNYLTRIPKQQGILSFWRGNTALIWMYLYQTVFQIGIYDSMKKFNLDMNSQLTDTPAAITVLDNIVFPLLASLSTLAVLQPLDTYRIHRTMSYHKSVDDALFTKFRHRMSQVGSIKNLYQGFWLANVISLINFNLYKHLYDAVGKVEVQGVPTDILNKELVLSILAVGLVHPLDTLKKIYQLNNMHKPQIFHNYRAVFQYLRQNKMQGALFNGMTASLVKTAIFIPVYWQVLKYWRAYVDGGEGKIV